MNIRLQHHRLQAKKKEPLGRLKRQSGFSLIELMIVLVIIGILAGLAIPRFLGSATKAKQTESKEMLHQIYVMERSFKLSNDRYWFPPDGVSASAADPYAFDSISVEIMPSARYTYSIERTADGFLAKARCDNLDDDPAPDIWTIDERGQLSGLSDDSVVR